ncbi:hypothetical protein MLD38_035800 [Melastoma candidum]|uniref:Uncharacterized protein n=1 Tax=Melastoma candidum TaxID=119954 RepID=A0ACB9LIM5_9MYRT|nr:hypothetical protein MLD38_035800 [Melastoma candidum]
MENLSSAGETSRGAASIRPFDSSSSSSGASNDDGDDARALDSFSVDLTTQRLDHILQFLDRKLSRSSPSPSDSLPRPLPEFEARGGGHGMFTLPSGGAIHPGTPPCLELRPQPSRETQAGCFLRTLASSSTLLWAGGERDVRVWDLSRDLYSPGRGEAEEADTAPFVASEGVTSPTLSMVTDKGARSVWTGHRDGKIRRWKMPPPASDRAARTHLVEALSWQAHRGPVLSITISIYGDLWSGSEGGDIRVWPAESLDEALLSPVEGHFATSSLERSYIVPRDQVGANGFTNGLVGEIKHLISDKSCGSIWSCGYASFALWDALSRCLLKVFNVDGLPENWGDMSVPQDFSTEFLAGSKKDKAQSSFGFLQRSRDVIIGAADAVRRATLKGAFGDDGRRIEAITWTVDGKIWTGCASGQLIQWDCNGNRLQDFQYHSTAVQCFCAIGTRIWVGYSSGTVQVLDLEGSLLGTWIAHTSPVIDLTAAAGYMFSLSNHGQIRGWNVTSPGPLDKIIRTELTGKEFLYTRMENPRILVGTWNVGQGKASLDSLMSWLGSAASESSIVVVGLQEVDMGAGFLAVSAAKETVGLEGSAAGQWWLDMIDDALDVGSEFERLGSRQLAGLLIAVWVRTVLTPHVGDVDVAAVPCGFGRAIGNKGAVGLRVRVYGRSLCLVNCHFAAHVEAIARRNADFDHVYRTMTFSRPSSLINVEAVAALSGAQQRRAANAMGPNVAEGAPELSEADMIIFLGDFNYRIEGISYDEARDFIRQRCFDWLREKDQLRAEMEAGHVFQGMREAVIMFPPTYKFERHSPGLAGYDSGEKKRIPAWCDRILYRDSRPGPEYECSLECPIVASVLQYEACMDVTDSDHKPVRCIFDVQIARVDESVRRQELGEVILTNQKAKTALKQLWKVPEIIISTNNIILRNHETSVLRVTNRCRTADALFQIVCKDIPRTKEKAKRPDYHQGNSFRFPRWLEVRPAAGIIEPDHTVEISVRREKLNTEDEYGFTSNWWREDNHEEEEVELVVKVSGIYMTETTNHCVRVCHWSLKEEPSNRTTNDSYQPQPNLLHRSDIQRMSNSYDVFDHLKNLTNP